ncbi:MAG: alpha/beta fold hydrolase [Anaerolineae bacterium]|nr:alpha/beta fold hydrolase [Anaerolineae bacterium]
MPNKAEDLVKMIHVAEDELQTYIRQEVPDREMEAFFGQHAPAVRLYASVDQIARKRGDSIIILLPGLSGSVLENVGRGAEVLWLNPIAFLKGHLNHLDMAEDGQSNAIPGIRIEAPNPIWIVYAKMLLRLQYAYEAYTFPYDWRRAPDAHIQQLQQFIDQKLAASDKTKVTLIGHSMGGLVILDYLTHEKTRKHAEQVVARAITLGTPFRGTLDAVVNLARGDDPKMEIARKLNRANDPQKMLRSLPGMYTILPAPKELYPDWNPIPDLDIWSPDTWQQANIPINRRLLEQGREHHAHVAAADPQIPFYSIAGTYCDTPVKLSGNLLTAIPRYLREGIQGGDGTVEVSSATFKDCPAYFVQEVHIELVLESKVIEGIMHWVEGGEPAGLVRQINEVVQDDMLLRGTTFAPQAIFNATQTAQKISANQALSREDIMALFGDKTLKP